VPLLAAGAGVAVTAAVAALPPLRFAYRNPELHLTLVTAEALIAMLAAVLAAARFRRVRRLPSLLLAAALGVLSLVNLLFAALPAVLASDTTVFSTWAAHTGRLLGALLLAMAALAPVHVVRRRSRLPWLAGAACALALTLIGVIVALLEPHLPLAIDPAATPARSGTPQLEGHPAILTGHGLGLALSVVAAVGFARRAADADPLLRALPVAAVFGAIARLNYLIFPSTATAYVYLGDAFRLLFYLLILAGALAELGSYWRSVADAAALQERQRIARDLHDGLAQELASIQRNLHYLDSDNRFVGRAREAADRSAEVARRALAALTAGSADPTLLTDAARAVAAREGVRLTLDVDDGVALDAVEREVAVAVASEAITNAARHGGAGSVRVELRDHDGVRLRVSDDGSGFDPGALATPDPGHGLGLAGMRARADAIGAQLDVRAQPGGGALVELRL